MPNFQKLILGGKMFYRILIFVVCFNTVLFAQNYTKTIGETTFSISSSLSLSNYGFLYFCQKRGDGYSHGGALMLSNYCQAKSFNDMNYYDSYDDGFMFSGWLAKNYVNTKTFENKWFDYVTQYEGLSKIIVTISSKFSNIFVRLYKAQQHRKKLENKFSEYKDDGINYDKYIDEIDSDIRLLSSHGMKLANVTKKLFNTIKPIIIDAEMRMDILSARKDTMDGLRSFEREMNRVSKLPQRAIDDSIDDIVVSIDNAIAQLERALAK